MSKIEWTHRPGTKSEVWNPTTGCDKISAGCRECYAEVMHKRLRGMGQPKYQNPFLGHLQMHRGELLKPVSWKKPRTVFVNSMSDLFHKDVTNEFLDLVFAMMVICYKHTFQILTKRADRMHEYFSVGKTALVKRWENAAYELGVTDRSDDPDIAACWVHNNCEQQWPRPNIWLGVSAENQEMLDDRVPHLVKVDAHIRFISYEPALGPIDCVKHFWIPDPHGAPSDFIRTNQITWVIAGGESGHNARPAHPDWFRSVRDQCKSAGVSYFFKQWGSWCPSEAAFHLVPVDQAIGDVFNEHRYVYRNGISSPFHETDYRDIDNDLCEWVVNVGKHKSGNTLDGVQHLEYPE